VHIAQTVAAPNERSSTQLCNVHCRNLVEVHIAQTIVAPNEWSSTCLCNPCCRRLKDTVHIAQTIAATIGAETAAPFEFRVLEALLAETAHHFEGKSR